MRTAGQDLAKKVESEHKRRSPAPRFLDEARRFKKTLNKSSILVIIAQIVISSQLILSNLI